MKFPELVAGRFIERENRFRVEVTIHGEPAAAHLPNSGRLADLLVPGCRLWLAAAAGPHRKTAFDLKLVEVEERLVSVDARLPGPLFVEAWRIGKVAGLKYVTLNREVKFDDSRLDYRFEGPEGACWVEAKSVTLVRDGQALFPDVPTTRGQKHLRALIHARERGERALVVFVVQRSDARSLTPHRAADPAFADLLREAASNGVEARAFRCQVNIQEIVIDREIPVHLD